ncbi:MAG: SGNH/GDSL hydrolase family protein [Anaerolineae bacterium]|nr:SGNH/GDSL hydrolase family protein [Anaerolineae bacterium]
MNTAVQQSTQTSTGIATKISPSPTLETLPDDPGEENAEEEVLPESSQTPAVTSTPLPIVLRQVPDDFNWKQLPIQPEINQHAFEIYEHGLSLGRDPTHISVIGDCQAIPFVFLGRYGLSQYTLSGTDTRLESMIDMYRDSFEREGAAVRGGFTAAAVLSPVRADPDQCMPGENPLECEWRINNPSIAFINLETWREEGTVDRYELYLQKIVEFTLAQGTLPIIIMKADKAEAETHVINPAMARVAYQYNVPIINFWQAVQYIENRGIDPDRDGFHLSEEGYHLKEILALRTLYDIWSVYQDTPQATPLPSLTPTVTPTPMPVKPELDAPNFQCEDNCLYYDLFVQSGSGVEPEGIYEFNLDTLEKNLIAEGVALMDVSLDQNLLLVTRGSELYIVNRNARTTELVIENLAPFSELNAYFSADQNTIVALTENTNTNRLLLIDADSLRISATIEPEPNPIKLLKYPDASDIYFEAGSCTALHFCTIESIQHIETNTKRETIIEAKERLVFSPDGLSMAFRDPQYADAINYYHNPILLYEEIETGIPSRRLFSFTHPGGFMVHPEITEYVFSSDSSRIFVLQDAYSDYFEKSVGLYLYLEDLDNRIVLDYGMLKGAYGSLSPIPVWSPNGEEMILLLINTENDRDFTLELFRKDMLSRFSEFEALMDPQALDGYVYPGHAFWIQEETNETE